MGGLGAIGARALPGVAGQRGLGTWAAVLAALLVLVGAGVAGLVAVTGEHGGGTAAPRSAGAGIGMLAGAPLQRAQCRHWQVAPQAERLGAVRGIASTVGGASTGGGVGTTLSEGAAVSLFDRYCATPATANFVLYIIYARAAAFSHTGAGDR